MKKLLTLTLIMLMALSLVLVSCSPNANKTDEAPKTQDTITDSQKEVLASRYSGLSDTLKDLASIEELKDDPNYSEERNITITPTANNGAEFSLLSDEDINDYNNIVDPPVLDENGDDEGSSAKIEEARKYSSVEFDISMKNTRLTDSAKYTLTKDGLVLKVTVPGTENPTTSYSDDENNSFAPISKSGIMEEYQALLTIQNNVGETITMESFVITKALSLVKEYLPEIKINTTFGTKEEGTIDADVVLSIDKENLINAYVKTATVKYNNKVLFKVSDSNFIISFDENFNAGLVLDTRTVDEEVEFYINFNKDDIGGGIRVKFDKAKINVPFTDKTVKELNFIATGIVNYDFSETELETSMEISDQTTLTYSGNTVTQNFVTVGFEYKGSIDSIMNAGDEGFAKFLNGFKVKKFEILSVPFDVEYINNLIKDNQNKIKEYITKILESDDTTETGGEVAPSDSSAN